MLMSRSRNRLYAGCRFRAHRCCIVKRRRTQARSLDAASTPPGAQTVSLRCVVLPSLPAALPCQGRGWIFLFAEAARARMHCTQWLKSEASSIVPSFLWSAKASDGFPAVTALCLSYATYYAVATGERGNGLGFTRCVWEYRRVAGLGAEAAICHARGRETKTPCFGLRMSCSFYSPLGGRLWEPSLFDSFRP